MGIYYIYKGICLSINDNFNDLLINVVSLNNSSLDTCSPVFSMQGN